MLILLLFSSLTFALRNLTLFSQFVPKFEDFKDDDGPYFLTDLVNLDLQTKVGLADVEEQAEEESEDGLTGEPN